MTGVVNTAKSLLMGPQAPDPGALAGNQAAINKQAIYDSAAVNQINQQGPGYNVSWSGDIGDPNRTMTYNLSEPRQAIADQMNAGMLAGSGYLGTPMDTSGVAGIPNYGDFAEHSNQVAQNQYDAIMSRISPDLENAWQRDTTMAANRGLPQGGEAWGDVQRQAGAREADAVLQAGQIAQQLGMQEGDRMFGQQMGAHQQGMQDIYGQRGQIAQELGLMHNLNPENTTSVPQPTQYQISPADYMGAEMAKYQGDVANRGSMIGGLSMLGAAGIMASDRRLKKNIERVGEMASGLPVYTYHYTWQHDAEPQHMGVMADEVEGVFPDAVITLDNGYQAVDYTRIH